MFLAKLFFLIMVGQTHMEFGFEKSYFIGEVPKSLQIFLARISVISECLGMAERLFKFGLYHQE